MARRRMLENHRKASERTPAHESGEMTLYRLVIEDRLSVTQNDPWSCYRDNDYKETRR